jgi:phage replication-related protein YjqB (UPF0714/DUF867 family)
VIDRYDSFLALRQHAPSHWWRALPRAVPDSQVLVIAPHGGGIENGTSELAAAIAGDEHNLYCFEGLRLAGNRELHVTSHRFDDPVALRLAGRCTIVIGIHGCRGESAIYVGGLDRALVAALTSALVSEDYPARSEGHPYPAIHPQNICNRGRRGAGVQLEFTADLRGRRHREPLARIVRQVLLDALKRAATRTPGSSRTPRTIRR